jgi:hypothetical protein
MASTGLSSSAAAADAASTPADIVVGIVSYNNADTVGSVVRAVCGGLHSSFGANPSCIVLADGGSTDATVAQARDARGGGCEMVTVEYSRQAADLAGLPFHGVPGRAEAIRAVLVAAHERQAKACALLDAGLLSVTADWISQLVAPALTGDFDYVSPYYLRHPYEGAITKSIIAPMLRALYGARVRQPAAGAFGCSSRLVQYFLGQSFFTGDQAQVGIDLWLVTAAASGSYRICEAALGAYKQAPRPGAPDVSMALTQIVGACFADLETHAGTWQRVRESTAVPVFGRLPSQQPPAPRVDVPELIDSFRLGYSSLRDIWAWILPPKVILQLKRLAEMPVDRFHIQDDVWARIVYDFALSYRLKTMPKDHLLGSLTPLYLGWLASFILEVRDMDLSGVDRRLDQLGLAFEHEKPYLISRWRWPESFRS